ncbi:hypothetical protein [Alicyclobacillus fructus]|uniref:hypothetical protein n=1 Tax=Alicyclobacillus fructus TaxID=2816082 RepID=UPI001A8E108F|nr:hypothetical protein [Alicyclobacillus fructus]
MLAGVPDAGAVTACAVALPVVDSLVRAPSVFAELVPGDALLDPCGDGADPDVPPLGDDGPVVVLPKPVALLPLKFPVVSPPVCPVPLDTLVPVSFDAPPVSPCFPAVVPLIPLPVPYPLSPVPFESVGEGDVGLVGAAGRVADWPVDLVSSPAPDDVLTDCVFGGIVSGFSTVATCSFGDQAGSLVGTTAAFVPAPFGAPVDPVPFCADRAPAALDTDGEWAAVIAYVCHCAFHP